MNRLLQYLGQLVAFVAFAVAVGYFSASPAFQYAADDLAVVKVSFSHAAQRVEPCVQLSPEEVAALAPNMRRTEACARERLPLWIELDLNGETYMAKQALPSGLWGDGPASVYEKLALAPGRYQVDLRLRDSDRADGWDYTHSADITLEAARYLTITFRAETGGFRIQ